MLADGDINKAREEALALEGTKHWTSIVTLFQEKIKPEKCPECGVNDVAFYFNAGTLQAHQGRICQQCVDAQEQGKKVQELTRLRDQFLERIDDRLKVFGVPLRFLKASLADFPDQYGTLHQGERGLFLTGPRGTGKTHLAVAIMRQICMLEATRSVVTRQYMRSMPIFISVPDLLLEIRDSYRDGAEETERHVIERYSNIPTLILDDLGAEKTTEWALQTLFVIIDRRYRNVLRTIITSNLSLEELSGKIGDRIASRIAEMCDVKIIKGEDRRLKR